MSTQAYLADFTFHGQRIPHYMHEGLIQYLEHHTPPGQFLSAVISNDLREACERADDTNIHLLHVYIAFLYNHAPIGSWGSPKAFKSWVKPESPQ